ncbi:ATP-binding protein involved in chromosome partitioning [Agrococcus baldri]|uniref:Iron-sulfur cluster carrier protein n=1 Tax=Agrococcus baldri TaxID=153730 RepID=A0AA94L0A5_9MICO|nr:Mrp/NBP35 family ATP-binding protein [Agrococcus baldri]SFS15416.1 ATP-binding protein involved in chromosome partitioning [Agrococcus baldri]
MTSPIDPALQRALATVIDPEIHRPLVELDMIPAASLDEGVARIRLELTVAACPAADRIEADVRLAAASVAGVERVEVDVGVMDPATRQALVERLRGSRPQQFGPGTLTRIIAVASGKGGVGKSTVTANLAVALAARGLAVGVIDADVHGYSIPALLGTAAKPTRVGDMMMPPEAHGVRLVSIGMFVDGNRSVSWRGPMLHRTLNQFVTDVWWGDLDVLLIDMPPGTGDVAISLGQLLPHAEVLVVTTPQKAAADVAERAAEVARQTGQRVLGVVENMAGLPQPDGSLLELFGSGGGDEAARRLDVPLLARIPLSVALREGGDAGEPVVAAEPGDPAAAAIIVLAESLRGTRRLSGRALPISPA